MAEKNKHVRRVSKKRPEAKDYSQQKQEEESLSMLYPDHLSFFHE